MPAKSARPLRSDATRREINTPAGKTGHGPHKKKKQEKQGKNYSCSFCCLAFYFCRLCCCTHAHTQALTHALAAAPTYPTHYNPAVPPPPFSWLYLTTASTPQPDSILRFQFPSASAFRTTTSHGHRCLAFCPPVQQYLPVFCIVRRDQHSRCSATSSENWRTRVLRVYKHQRQKKKRPIYATLCFEKQSVAVGVCSIYGKTAPKKHTLFA